MGGGMEANLGIALIADMKAVRPTFGMTGRYCTALTAVQGWMQMKLDIITILSLVVVLWTIKECMK
jgi:hypothetical protein